MQTLAAKQARKKSIELSKSGVLSMQFVSSPGEPSPQLSGEEEFAPWCWEVLAKNGVQENYKQILMIKGRHLNHFSNRADKISTMQEICGTRLLPLAVPLNDLTDYTSSMLVAEGFKELWAVGQEPPASVVECTMRTLFSRMPLYPIFLGVFWESGLGPFIKVVG